MDRLDPRSITRDELSRFLPSHKLIKAFEKLLKVVDSTPDEINGLIASTQAAQDSADSAQVAAILADSVAQLALRIAHELEDGPTPVQLHMTARIDDLSGQISSISAQINAILKRLAAIEERPTP